MDLAKTILNKAEEYSNYTATNLSKLIKIKSLSGEEEGVAKALKQMMEEAGFDEAKNRRTWKCYWQNWKRKENNCY